jgi:hypothetical protein
MISPAFPADRKLVLPPQVDGQPLITLIFSVTPLWRGKVKLTPS